MGRTTLGVTDFKENQWGPAYGVSSKNGFTEAFSWLSWNSAHELHAQCKGQGEHAGIPGVTRLQTMSSTYNEILEWKL